MPCLWVSELMHLVSSGGAMLEGVESQTCYVTNNTEQDT